MMLLSSWFGKRRKARRPGNSAKGLRPARVRLTLEQLEDRLAPAIFTVNTVADNTLVDSLTTLREAILAANASAGADTINLNIPGSGVQTISPTSPLPTITGPTTIDGYSQPGSSPNTLAVGNNAVLLIELNGASAGTVNGLHIAGGGSTVRGLVVNRFALNGLRFFTSGGNRVEGNFIGTDATGTVDLGNGNNGVLLLEVGNNVIGGAAPAARNVIADNAASGISISGTSANENVVEGNYIGTNAAGTAAIPNGTLATGMGVYILGGSANRVGGTASGAGNVLSGNGQHGIGIFSATATGNVVEGNFIGTNPTGTAPIPNGLFGVVIVDGASGNVVGGPTQASRNVISGNTQMGVVLLRDTHDNLIKNNRIGTNASGSAALGNGGSGVYFKDRGFANTVANNLISANGGAGVDLFSESESLIQGNYIGTMADGVTPLGNTFAGIFVSGSSENTVIGNRVQHNGRNGITIFESTNNTIGGPTEAERNLISGNGGTGVSIFAGSSGNEVKGNWIGVDASGIVALPNAINGVTIATGAHDNTIGGPNQADRNVITGNGGPGVQITNDASGNLVQNNCIGAAANGAPLGNGVNQHGVGIFNNADNNSILDNLILANSRSGISVAPADSTGNTFYRNRIIGNGWLPIDLQDFSNANQVTLNDLGDGDTGANNYQNFPFVASVSTLVSGTDISGSLYSAPSTTYRLEFFAADTLSPSGHRQAQYILGTLDVTTNPTGLATFVFEYSGSLPGSIVTAAATNLATGDTSEFFNPSKPTNITLSNQTLQENAGANVLVGDLTTTDPDLGDSHFYTLVGGAGDTDNALFTIVGNQLVAIASLNYEDGATRSVRIRTTDLHGLTFEKSFTITVLNLVDLSGRVFDDGDNDGLFDPGDGETGIGGVTVQLFNQTSGTLIATVTTAADGTYYFDVKLSAGTYRLVAAQPAGFLDGRETAGNLGGTLDNSQDSDQISGIIVGDPGTTADAIDYLFAEIRPSQALGLVWSDFNNDGEVNFSEAAIAGAAIELAGIDDRGNAVNRSATTDGDGIYAFIDLRPSNAAGYTIRESQPAGYVDGLDVLGTVNGLAVGNGSVNDVFSGVVLPRPGLLAENYNFGERPAADGGVSAGQTATIGFWQNNNGQNLIQALNGGSTSTQLSAWLAATFPNLYGASAGANNLTGKTNTQVAAFYKTHFARTAQCAAGGGPAKMDAQVLATAFAVYVTNQSLAGMTAASYGFLVTANGVGTRTFNVDSDGAAFGVADNTDVSVLDLLLAVNNRSWNGLLYDLDSSGDANDALETSYRTMANNVFSAINEAGDI